MKRLFTPILTLFATLLFIASVYADSIIWTGAGGNPNWSTGGNWTNATAGTSGTAPSAADVVSFFDNGALSPTVDTAFAGTIASLRFGSTNNDYATAIDSGKTLIINGTNGLRVGTPGDTSTAVSRTATFTGAGAALNLSNTLAGLVLNQGTGTGVNGSRATLDLQNLDTFRANLSGIGIGTTHYPFATNQRLAGVLYLAKTNLITLTYSQPLSVYLSNASATNGLEISHNPGNPPGTLGFLYLGQSNAIFVDSIGVGRTKASTTSAGTIQFNPALTSPYAYFRGVGGPTSRVTWWSIGDMCDNASSSQHAVGTNSFAGGTIDALVDTMSLGRDCVPNHAASGSGRINTGVLTFDNGTINVNTLIVGNQSLAQAASTSVTPNYGYVNVNSANATLVVNNTLKLADTSAQNHTGAQQTYARVSVDGGTLRANTITIGPNTVTNALLILTNNATLVLSNTLASIAKPLRNLNMSDSTFVFNLNGASPVAVISNVATAGSGNTVQVASSITFASYPAQVVLLKYANLTGSGNNFTLGSVPGNVVNAYLSNNTFNSSIDLVIPKDPRPIITNTPGGFSGPPGSLVSMTVGADGAAPFSYQWRRDGTNISDSGNVSGTTTDTVTITSAQPSNNGSFTVVVGNAYGSTTSSPPAVVTISSGNVAPGITGPNNQSVVQGDTATLTASVSGVPSPSLQWYKGGTLLPGETTASLAIANAQYPADEATYSIVATNTAGKATNSATLTVLVPPGIATQPSNATVPQGSPASFTVVATGHPNPAFQWSKNLNVIAGQTNATLSFASATPADAATYAVLISNAGGSTSSVPVTLTVTSTTLAATNLSPANGASGVCYDTPLYIKFNNPPALGTSTLRIYDSGDTLVDTIDLSQNDVNNGQLRTIGGGTYYTYPVIIRSNSAAIFPHLGVLTSNTTYYVLMDTDFFKDAGGASFTGISSHSAWQFTTKAAGPDPGTVTNIIVSGDGSGDFVTVQGAIDWVPGPNTTPITIQLRKGTYEEINRIPTGKNNLTFIGDGWQESLIAYANNNTFQLTNASTSTRVMFYAGGNDLVFKNLVFTNSTPQGGSQAEALRIQGLRIIVDNCKLASYQDTLLLNTANTSSGYVNKSLIQGEVDFIWGSGIGYFKSCEIRALQRTGNSQGINTQPRTGAGVYGLIFYDCNLSRSSASITNWTLGRDANTSGPNGNCAYLKCRLDSHIIPAGWTDGGQADKSTLRFWEYQSKDITGTTLVPTNSRVAWSRQLDDSEFDTVSNPTNVFASILWEPSLAPWVARQPADQSALVGQTVTLGTAIGGIPEPVYQWYRGSSPVPGGTNFNLVIPNAQTSDSGSYSLRVTNDLGFVITSNAVLTVSAAVRPTITAPARLGNGYFQFSISGGLGQPYRVWGSTNVAATPVTSTWTSLGSGTFGASPVTFTDASATNFARRFYVISVP